MSTQCTWLQAGPCLVVRPHSAPSASGLLVRQRCRKWVHLAGAMALRADTAGCQAILLCSSNSWQTACTCRHHNMHPARHVCWPEHHRRRHCQDLMCLSSAGDRAESQPIAETTQSQQAGLQADSGSSESLLGRQYTAALMPNLEQQVTPRVHPLLAWLPPPLRHHTQGLLGFLRACWRLLPEFASPSLPEALRRLALVLGASLVMIVVISTIDSAWLYLYLLSARRVPVAA